MAKPRKTSVNRRGFLKGAAVGAAAGATAMVTDLPSAEAQAPAQAAPGGARGKLPALRHRLQNSSPEMQGMPGHLRHVRAVNRPGSDLMVQVLKDLGVEYAAANPGSSFEGLQESVHQLRQIRATSLRNGLPRCMKSPR